MKTRAKGPIDGDLGNHAPDDGTKGNTGAGAGGWAGLRGDRASIALLLLLYTLQVGPSFYCAPECHLNSSRCVHEATVGGACSACSASALAECRSAAYGGFPTHQRCTSKDAAHIIKFPMFPRK